MPIVPGKGPAYLHSFSKPHVETGIRGTEQPTQPWKSLASRSYRPEATVENGLRVGRHGLLWESHGEASSLVNIY